MELVWKYILDYVLVAGFGWILILCWLVPFQIFYVKMNKKQFWRWIKLGSIIELITMYPISKAIIFVSPQITDWVFGL